MTDDRIQDEIRGAVFRTGQGAKPTIDGRGKGGKAGKAGTAGKGAKGGEDIAKSVVRDQDQDQGASIKGGRGPLATEPASDDTETISIASTVKERLEGGKGKGKGKGKGGSALQRVQRQHDENLKPIFWNKAVAEEGSIWAQDSVDASRLVSDSLVDVSELKLLFPKKGMPKGPACGIEKVSGTCTRNGSCGDNLECVEQGGIPGGSDASNTGGHISVRRSNAEILSVQRSQNIQILLARFTLTLTLTLIEYPNPTREVQAADIRVSTCTSLTLTLTLIVDSSSLRQAM